MAVQQQQGIELPDVPIAGVALIILGIILFSIDREGAGIALVVGGVLVTLFL